MQEKTIVDFHKDKSKKDGLSTACKSCRNNYKKENIESISIYQKKYNTNYRAKNNDKIKIKTAEYSLKTKDKKSEYDKTNYQKNKEKIKARNKKYADNNPAKTKERNRKYADKFKDKINTSRRNYDKTKRKEDVLFKLRGLLRCRIYHAFKVRKWTKGGHSQELLGATYIEVREHLQSLFQPGMNWKNHGEWEIDHLQPLAFGRNEKELIRLCHYKNLQPLWKDENRLKKAKILITPKGEYKLLLI